MDRTLAAGGLIIAAMALIALADNWVRHVTADIGLWQFQLMRGMMAFALLGSLAAVFGWRLRPKRPGRVALRSAFSSGGMLLYFGALSLMTINQAGAGLYTAPIWVLVISALGFGVAVGPVRIAAVGLGFAGVLVVLQPWGDVLSWQAAAVALAAGALHATGAVLTRQLCAGESTATMNLGYFIGMGVWGIIGMGAVYLLDLRQVEGASGFFSHAAVWPSAGVTGWIALQTLFGVAATGLLIRGYQMAEASRITVFDYSFLPLAGMWAWLLFGDVPDWSTVAGTGLIIAAGVVIAFRSKPAAPVAAAPTPAGAVDQPGKSK